MKKGWRHRNSGRNSKWAKPSSRAHSASPVSEYSTVWLFAMFDLPVTDERARREYTRFRKLLLDEGFDMLQYSVYARFFRSVESSKAKRDKIQAHLPPDGQVRLLMVTDHQFGKMEVFYGKESKKVDEPPPQLLLF